MNIIRKVFIALMAMFFLSVAARGQDVLVYRAFNPFSSPCSDASNVIIFQMNQSFPSGSYKCAGGFYAAFTFGNTTLNFVTTQAQLQAALVSNSNIVIPQNTSITLTSTRILTGLSNVIISGSGASSILNVSGGDFPAFTLDNSSNITFKDFTCVGDFNTLAAPSRNSQRCVLTSNTSTNAVRGLTINNVTSDGLSGDTIRIGPNTHQTLIVGCHMLSGLAFLEISGVNTGGDVRPVNGYIVQNNFILGSVSSPRTPVLGMTGSDDIIDIFGGANDGIIANNFFDLGANAATTTTNSTAILSNPAVAQGPITKLLIQGNTIRRFISTASAVVNHAGIMVAGDTFPGGNTDVSVIDNLIDTCNRGIVIGNNTGLGNAVRGNTITACVYGIDNNNSDDVEITNNIIKFPTNLGAFLQGVRTKFVNNKFFLDSTLAVGNKTGLWATTGNNKVITHNTFSGGVATSFSARIVSGNNTKFFDNTILNNPGTGLDILAGALSSVLTGNTLSGNGTNYNNGEATTIAYLNETGVAGEFITAPLFRSTTAKVLLQGTGAGATQLSATQTTAPTCTTNCGTGSPTVTGTDTFMTVNLGTTPASGFVVLFNGTWASAPACVAQMAVAGMVVGKQPLTVVTTTSQLTVVTNGTAPATGDKYHIHCSGTQ